MGLESVELILDVEDAFGISIPDQQASCLYTVGDLHECICAALTKPNVIKRAGQCWHCGYSTRGLTSDRCPECGKTILRPEQVDPDAIWRQLVAIIVKGFGEKPEDIQPGTRFVEDLKF